MFTLMSHASNVVMVDLANMTRPIQHQGSGILYGFSADATEPPAKYSRAVKLQYYRGGGGHSAPGYELDQGAGFDKLWSAAAAMVSRAHGEGAQAILVMCDLWAKFDNGAGRGIIPGDNGSWTLYDAFVDNIVRKVYTLGIVANAIQFELWNEPARGFFWRGNDEAAWLQYLAMWHRGFKRLRAALPHAVVVGPSIWGGADPGPTGNTSAGLFNQWLDATKTEGTFPDVLSWHVLSDSSSTDYNPSPAFEVPRMRAALASRKLPTTVKLMINEYGGGKAQDGPASAAWWLANLERYNIAGCRSIECECCEDPNLSCMLTSSTTSATTRVTTTTPIFDVYAAYANMSGSLVAVDIDAAQTAPFDAVASIDEEARAAWVLLGQASNETGPYTMQDYQAALTLKGLPNYLVENGTARVTIGSAFPLDPATATRMPVVDGMLKITLNLGGQHANAWYFIRLDTPSVVLSLPNLTQKVPSRVALVGTPEVAEGPCDITGAAGNPCVAAHSTVRALYADYDGGLYIVQKNHTQEQMTIGVLTPGGYADKAKHDQFCVKLDCVILSVFDQSPMKNHLTQRHGLINASRHPIIVGDGVGVYGMWFDPGYGYHVDDTRGIAKGNEPESIYAVMSGSRHTGVDAAHKGCCFDYGNSEGKAASNTSDGSGAMEAIYFGNTHWMQNAGDNTTKGPDGKLLDGPWVGADLEAGMYYGGGKETKYNMRNKPLIQPFVSLYLRGGTNGFALKGGDATKGKLRVMYDGPRPDCKVGVITPPHPDAGQSICTRQKNNPYNVKRNITPSYQPMHKQGAIVLATGGDNSNSAIGNFYEGIMVTGVTSDATDDLVQANIVGVNYKNVPN